MLTPFAWIPCRTVTLLVLVETLHALVRSALRSSVRVWLEINLDLDLIRPLCYNGDSPLYGTEAIYVSCPEPVSCHSQCIWRGTSQTVSEFEGNSPRLTRKLVLNMPAATNACFEITD